MKVSSMDADTLYSELSKLGKIRSSTLHVLWALLR